MRAFVVVAVMVLCASGSARADEPVDAAKQLLAEQVRALNAGDAKAFAATFASADNVEAALFLPTAADEAFAADDIAAATAHWLAATGKLALALDKPHYSDDQQVGAGAWFDADYVGGGKRYRVSGIVIKTAFEREDDFKEGPYKIAAEHISEAVDDKAVLAAAGAGKLPALPKLDGEGAGDSSDPARVVAIGKNVYPSHAVSVIGSAPNERALGPAAVKKLLAGWRSLRLVSIGRKHGRDREAMGGFEWELAHVEATFMVKGKPVKVPYRAFLIVASAPAAAVDHGAPDSELLHAHFSVATH